MSERKNAGHTPGPWRIERGPRGRCVIRDADGNTPGVATVHNAHGHYDARLIAAAPELKAENERLQAVVSDLLAAAKSMRFYIEGFKGESEMMAASEFYDRIKAALPIYDAAIRKARGES